jgi:hypothetical protein
MLKKSAKHAFVVTDYVGYALRTDTRYKREPMVRGTHPTRIEAMFF